MYRAAVDMKSSSVALARPCSNSPVPQVLVETMGGVEIVREKTVALSYQRQQLPCHHVMRKSVFDLSSLSTTRVYPEVVDVVQSAVADGKNLESESHQLVDILSVTKTGL